MLKLLKIIRKVYLGNNVTVGDTDDHAVLGRVVFVLILDDKPFTRIVISSSLTTPFKLDLKALEVRFVLDNLDETLQKSSKITIKISIKF